MIATPPVLVFVGGGPRTVSLLERIAANGPALLGSATLDIHIVDPFPAGGGRIWRRNQSPLLWMNSVAKDVTIFTDDSVICEGPIVAGPTLDAWVVGPGRSVLIEAGLRAEADAFDAKDFASREFQSLYLGWAFDRVVDSLPDTVTVTVHRQRAVSVTDDRAAHPRADRHATSVSQQQVRLADGTLIRADIVVLAQGYLDRHATASQVALQAAAQQHGLTYISPGYTADIDLDPLRPGGRVLVRGFGLAFVDVMVLVLQGRGGRFREHPDGGLEYLPSGAEPVLYVGSRRGVPYHAKLGYTLGAAVPVPPTYFTADAVAAATESGGTADFVTRLWPLIVKELAHAHYRRLIEFHSERVSIGWDRFSAALAEADVTDPGFTAFVASVVPAPEDRFDLGVIDRPLRGRVFADRDELSVALVAYISDDLRRRADPRHSADAAVFNALVTVEGVLGAAVAAGQISATDRVQHVEGEFRGLFSFLASGPPPRRLAEMLAVHRAGFLHFAGPDLQVRVHHGRFVGTSPAVGGVIEAEFLIDARLPSPDVRSASDPVIAGLLAAGEIAAEDLVSAAGIDLGGGKLLADNRARAVRADRTAHPRRFLLGPSISGSAGSAGFARPGFNGAGFRQNDSVARELLTLVAGIHQQNSAARAPTQKREQSCQLSS